MAKPRSNRPRSEDAAFVELVCDRIVHKELDEGVTGLSEPERTVFRAYIFRYERANGGLNRFFESTFASRPAARATVAALRMIGAERTAAIVEQAATLFKRNVSIAKARSWEAYLAQVDPENLIGTLDGRLPPRSREDISGLLQAYVIRNRRSFEAFVD